MMMVMATPIKTVAVAVAAIVMAEECVELDDLLMIVSGDARCDDCQQELTIMVALVDIFIIMEMVNVVAIDSSGWYCNDVGCQWLF